MAGTRKRWPAVLAFVLLSAGAPFVHAAAPSEPVPPPVSSAAIGETSPAAGALRAALAELRALARPPFPEAEREALRERLLSIQHRLDLAMNEAMPEGGVPLIRSAMRRIFDIDLADPAITDRHIARLLELSIGEIEAASAIAVAGTGETRPLRWEEAAVESYWLLGVCFLLVPVPILLTMAVLNRRARKASFAAGQAPSEAEARKARELEKILTLAKAPPAYGMPRGGAGGR